MAYLSLRSVLSRKVDAQVDAEGDGHVLAEVAAEGAEGEQEDGCVLVPDVLVVEGGGAIPVLVDGGLDRVLTAL